ncbi:MAG: hypothetical protein E7Z64_06480 [Thermoplasmata archaeon]|nr:hypothetical protein [Thermoplasmata archaeon]
MMKGPLVYVAIGLAVILMILSAVMVLNRDFFLDNAEIIAGISGVLALAVVAVIILIMMRYRDKPQ